LSTENSSRIKRKSNITKEKATSQKRIIIVIIIIYIILKESQKFRNKVKIYLIEYLVFKIEFV